MNPSGVRTTLRPRGVGPRSLVTWRTRRGLVLLSLLLAAGFLFYYYTDRYVRLGPTAEQINVTRLEETVRRSPEDPHLRLRLAEAYASQRRGEDAVKQYQASIKLQDENPAAYLGLGNTYYAQGKHTQAEGAYQRVIAFYEDKPYRRSLRPLNELYYNLGVIYQKNGRLEEAVTSLEEAIAIDRVDADALHLLGVVKLRQGRTEEAVLHCEEAARYVPDFKEAYETLAAAYGQLGQRELQVFAQGMVRYSQKDFTGASAILEEAARSLPDKLMVQVGLALAHEKSGEREKALSAYKAAERLDPDSFLVKRGIGRLSQP